MNIGVLGGTFDPVHIGHLIVAEEARVRLGLEEVLFVPAGQPWQKQGSGITPAYHRVEMVRLAIAGNRHFRLCVNEAERPGPSYSVDTMLELRKQLGSEAGLFFILGRDALGDLHRWKEPERLIQLCQLVVAHRRSEKQDEGSVSGDLEHLEAAIPGLRHRVIELDMPLIEVSSSGIRERIGQGLSIRYLVPEGVEQYIAEQGLYLRPAG
ncbi:MAG: nicotinate-nucleotide adenylyltransferase [Dehalococcoidia bacterium]